MCVLQMREDYYAGLEDRYFLEFDQAKGQKLAIDFDATPPVTAPKDLGVTLIDSVKLADVVPYIDWVSSNHAENFQWYLIFSGVV